eukprot:scaffold2889_cov407-Prasinococcus_capsulatus_cf.AAC.3
MPPPELPALRLLCYCLTPPHPCYPSLSRSPWKVSTFAVSRTCAARAAPAGEPCTQTGGTAEGLLSSVTGVPELQWLSTQRRVEKGLRCTSPRGPCCKAPVTTRTSPRGNCDTLMAARNGKAGPSLLDNGLISA